MVNALFFMIFPRPIAAFVRAHLNRIKHKSLFRHYPGVNFVPSAACGARDGGELGMTSVALAYASETTPAPQMAFSERVARLLDRIDCRLIEKDDEREAVFRLRYDAYLREAAIPPNISPAFS